MKGKMMKKKLLAMAIAQQPSIISAPRLLTANTAGNTAGNIAGNTYLQIQLTADTGRHGIRATSKQSTGNEYPTNGSEMEFLSSREGRGPLTGC